MNITQHHDSKYSPQELHYLQGIAFDWFCNQTDPIRVYTDKLGRFYCETHDAGRGENLYMAHDFVADFYRKHGLKYRMHAASPVLLVMEPCPSADEEGLARMQNELSELARKVFEQEQSIRLNRVSFDAFVTIPIQKKVLYDMVYIHLCSAIDARLDIAFKVAKERGYACDNSALEYLFEFKNWFINWWARNDHLEKRYHHGKGCCR